MAVQLCDHLDIEQLANRLSRSGDERPKEVGEWINTLHALIPPHRKLLWASLDKKQIATALSLGEDVADKASCLEQIHSAEAAWATEVCTELDPVPLASMLRRTEDVEGRDRFLAIAAECCPPLHQELLRLMNE